MIYEKTKCETCIHRIKGTSGCKAFDVIPEEIYFEENKHDKPIKGQKGNFVFEKEK